MNKEVQQLFEEEQNQSTLKNVEKGKLFFSSPHGNHKRSRMGEKWFYFGETAENYSLFYDEVVGESDSHYFLRLHEDGEWIADTLVAIEKNQFEKRYPVQPLFATSMEETEAVAILKDHFKLQTERSTTIL